MKKLILTLLLAIVCVPAWASPWDAPNSFEIVKESSWDYRTARALTEAGGVQHLALDFMGFLRR